MRGDRSHVGSIQKHEGKASLGTQADRGMSDRPVYWAAVWLSPLLKNQRPNTAPRRRGAQQRPSAREAQQAGCTGGGPATAPGVEWWHGLPAVGSSSRATAAPDPWVPGCHGRPQ